MPPRTYRTLTPEELDELQAELAPRAAVPRLPVSAAAPAGAVLRANIGPATITSIRDPAAAPSRVMLPETRITAGEDPSKDAWLDELIGNPPSTPRRPMVSASGPAGSFTGEDSPEARELIKQRGMQVTEQSPPGDEDLLNALTSQRPASMPELDDRGVDDLISAESAAMDREKAQQATPAAAPRRSREDELLDVIEPPTRTQGWLAVLGDALYGGHMVDNVNARAHGYQTARAQARMQDLGAAEKAEDQAADREMLGRRLALTERGQDLANARGEENQYLRWLLEQQRDQRVREEGAAGRGAAMERTQVMANSRADAGVPDVTPEQKTAGLAGFLMQQVNGVPLAQVRGYLEGNRDGIAPDKLEQLDATLGQWQIASPKTQQSMLGRGLGREGATPDSIWRAGESKRQDPKLRLAIKDDLTAQNAALNAAVKAWKELSPGARAAIAKIGPNGDLAEAGFSPEDQARAARIQALANFDIKHAAGSAVTGSEWKRIAGEIGLPDGISAFKSPQVLDRWLRQHIDLFKRMQGNALSEFPNLFEEGQ